MKKILLKLFVWLTPIFLPMILSGMVRADILYYNHFAGVEPPTNWTIGNTSDALAAVDVTFTAQSGTNAYMALTATTSTGDKFVDWAYSDNAAKSWGDVSLKFAVVSTISDTNTAFDFGVRTYNPTLGTLYFVGYQYNNTGGASGAWQITPIGQSSSTPIPMTITALDQITLSITGFPGTVQLYQNASLINTGTSLNTGNYANCYQGTIIFGLHRTTYGVSSARISTLEVDGTQLTATPTNTPTYTPTDTPTLTATPTFTATYTSTTTPTATPTCTATPTASPTSTNTPTITPTFTCTATPIVYYSGQYNTVCSVPNTINGWTKVSFPYGADGKSFTLRERTGVWNLLYSYWANPGQFYMTLFKGEFRHVHSQVGNSRDLYLGITSTASDSNTTTAEVELYPVP
jgi:hypothetical protein